MSGNDHNRSSSSSENSHITIAHLYAGPRINRADTSTGLTEVNSFLSANGDQCLTHSYRTRAGSSYKVLDSMQVHQ